SLHLRIKERKTVSWNSFNKSSYFQRCNTDVLRDLGLHFIGNKHLPDIRPDFFLILQYRTVQKLLKTILATRSGNARPQTPVDLIVNIIISNFNGVYNCLLSKDFLRNKAL